jgi:plasmid replication initiation protein
VLAQNRTTLQEWEKEINLDALGTIKVQCKAARDSVVPHGIDNDILLGIVTAAVLQNTPVDGVIWVTVLELLQLSGVGVNSRAYQAVDDSLERLRSSDFRIAECWYDQGQYQWRTVSFSIIYKHWAEDNTASPTSVGQWRAETKIGIRIDDELMQSIRKGYIRPLEIETLEKLKQPMARNLYRTLSILRTKDEMHYQVPLSAWAVHLGLHHMRADTIMRALHQAHQALIDTGYLKDVESTGRGLHRILTYVFAKDRHVETDPESLILLTARHISGPRALHLLQQYGAGRIVEATQAFDQLLMTEYAKKIRNKPGFLADLIENPEKYVAVLNGYAPLPKASPRLQGESPRQDAPDEPPTDGEGMVRSVLAALVTREKISAAEEAVVISMHAQGRVTPMEVTGLVAHPRPAEVIGRWVVRAPA